MELEIADLIQEGMPPEHVAGMRAQALYDTFPSIIWHENKLAVQVYCVCQWTIHMGMGGTWYQGISQQEILATFSMLGVPATDQADVMYRVRYLVSCAQPVYQSKVKK